MCERHACFKFLTETYFAFNQYTIILIRFIMKDVKFGGGDEFQGKLLYQPKSDIKPWSGYFQP
jgi:hypothetical protein